MSVYGMAIDSILQCSIIDEEINKVFFNILLKTKKNKKENRPTTKILPVAAKGFL
jgi:hypothetical protein